MRPRHFGFAVTLLALAACDKQVAPVTPLDEVDLAASLSVQAQTAMGGEANGPASILRNLVQQIRAGDNERAKAQLARADELSARAAASGDRALAQEAHVLVVQVVAAVFPNAQGRISEVVRTGLERARVGLGTRDAPRVRAVLDKVGLLLRQSAAAQAGGRPAIALDLALQAHEMLGKLADHVRG